MENTFTISDEGEQEVLSISPMSPEPTLELIMGDVIEEEGRSYYPFLISLPVTKTLYNRFRYWMFGKFFPFKVKWLI